ncbi:Scr1 family TA system antitoxin-like transcriptional regulator [Glycomyces sp. NPDC021274]|uniref:Scr1 family TA system antitoxin-like transcriptional regulator n=1 Tax=Glycomyces sp. NPDC021274 TaxID=3155120 RepID=UPI0033EE9197
MVIEDSAWWFLKTMGRTHRIRSHRTQKEVGDAIPRSEDTVRAWELGRADIPVALAEGYGKACGMDDESAGYMKMVAAARKKGEPIEADAWFNALFIALAEGYCGFIFKFDALIIPGPLQTRAFHYTVMPMIEPSASKTRLDKGWAFKEERAEALQNRTDRPTIMFLIGEAALLQLRRISEQLYQEQMENLRKWARRPGASIRVLRVPVYARYGNFSIYKPGDSELACPSFVYTESVDSSWCIDDPSRIASYDDLRKKLWKMAIRIEVYHDDDRRDRLA